MLPAICLAATAGLALAGCGGHSDHVSQARTVVPPPASTTTTTAGLSAGVATAAADAINLKLSDLPGTWQDAGSASGITSLAPCLGIPPSPLIADVNTPLFQDVGDGNGHVTSHIVAYPSAEAAASDFSVTSKPNYTSCTEQAAQSSLTAASAIPQGSTFVAHFIPSPAAGNDRVVALETDILLGQGGAPLVYGQEVIVVSGPFEIYLTNLSRNPVSASLMDQLTSVLVQRADAAVSSLQPGG